MKCSPTLFLFPYMLDHLERFLYTRRTKISIMLSCIFLYKRSQVQVFPLKAGFRVKDNKYGTQMHSVDEN
jgi:hypothetical protein